MSNNHLKNDQCEITCVHDDVVDKVKSKMLDENTILGLSQTFKALSDSTRLKIIYALLQSELCVCDIASILNMTQSAISHQLRVLRNLSLVKYRKEGKVAIYSLDDEHVAQLLNQGLEHVMHQKK